MRNPIHMAAFGLYGAAAMLGQVLVVRELMAALRGNELAVGLALGGWLLMAGGASWAGSGLFARFVSPSRALGWAFAAFSVLLPVATVAPRALMPILGYSQAEVVPASGVALVVLGTLFLAAPLAGLMFPLSSASVGDMGETGPPRVYMFESLGGFAAGALFTFVMAPALTPLQGAALAALGCAAGAYLMSGPSGDAGLRAAAAIAALASLALFAAAPNIELRAMELESGRAGRVLDARWSKYGVVSVSELPGQHAVYQDGRFSFSVPDPDAAGPAAHLTMLVHARPERVLLVGGGPEIAAEMLKHPVSSLDYVELDPAVIEAAAAYLPADVRAALDDPRLRVHFIDGRRFVKQATDGGYDLVAVMLPEPSTASVNRYYTLEFFREASTALAPGGVFSIGLPSSPNYIGRAQLMLNGTVYRTLMGAFPNVRVTPEETNRFFASFDPDAVSFDPETLSRRYAGRGISAKGFDRHAPGFMLMPDRVDYVEHRLADEPGLGVNRDFRPVAYLYSLALWAETAGMPGVERLSNIPASLPGSAVFYIAAVLAAGAALAVLARRRPASGAAVVITTTGFSGMALDTAALLAFQSFYGYLYELIGLLVALFMLGLFAGSHWGAAVAASGRNAARTLALAEAVMALGALVLSGLHLIPDGALPGLVLGFLILGFGIVTGFEYPLALTMAGRGRSGRRHAGLLYGLDLAGAGLGALAGGLLLVPLFGIAFTALAVVILKSIMAAVLLAGRRLAHDPPLQAGTG